ncbi:hypothetical protein XENORESO_003962 [Xenotaenia resolanae]|uniref:Uncharacterized protein n=1 Tax=Xenotaenia resolanae TaxID=208358 RepID=A0ABV0WE01_9TELE
MFMIGCERELVSLIKDVYFNIRHKFQWKNYDIDEMAQSVLDVSTALKVKLDNRHTAAGVSNHTALFSMASSSSGSRAGASDWVIIKKLLVILSHRETERENKRIHTRSLFFSFKFVSNCSSISALRLKKLLQHHCHCLQRNKFNVA